MKLNPAILEDSSVIYYFPLPSWGQDFLYYPISAGYFECKSDYAVSRNGSNAYLLIVMLAGSLSYQTRHERGVARAGQTLLLDCNAPHAYAAQGKCSFTFVHFDGAQSRMLVEEIAKSCGSLIRVANTNMLHESIGAMMDAIRGEKRVSEAETSALLYSMLMELLHSSGQGARGAVGNAMVDRAIDYIQQHLMEKLDVGLIAANAGYSPGYFAHIFARETGLSPYQFVVKSRVEYAQQLLRTTEMSIQDVAFQAGFNSVSNFCYTFRRQVGASPQQYRRRPI